MEVIDIYNNKKEVNCLGCAINTDEYIPPCGTIFKTEYFAINQDCEIPIPGFMIVSSKRHIHSIDDFTDEEQKDFISLVVKLRKGMREVLNIDRISMIVAELPGRQGDHFRLWMYPVTKESEKRFGFGIKAIKPMMLYAKENMKTPENINKVEENAQKLKNYFATK